MITASANPLFIPLNGHYYDLFESGNKDTEYRLNGKRWNLKTCFVGRQVILSRGYGKQNRLSAKIYAVNVVKLSALHFSRQALLRNLFRLGSLDNPEIIMIEMDSFSVISSSEAA